MKYLALILVVFLLSSCVVSVTEVVDTETYTIKMSKENNIFITEVISDGSEQKIDSVSFVYYRSSIKVKETKIKTSPWKDTFQGDGNTLVYILKLDIFTKSGNIVKREVELK